MATLGIIPARQGSKRLPGKNVADLGGKPLVRWAIEAALGASRLDRIVVTSDDPRVLAIAEQLRPGCSLERPAELATDTALAIEYVRHALAQLEAAGAGPFETIVIVQATSPLTLAEDIDATVGLLHDSGADSAVSVYKIDHIHPFKLKVMEGDRLLPYLEEERGRMAAHQLSDIYMRNGSVYATRRAVVESGEIIGPDCRAHVMPRERSVDIDDAVDFELARLLLARQQRG